MTAPEIDNKPQTPPTGTPEVRPEHEPEEPSIHSAELAEIAARHRRSPVIHWTAFVLSLVALVPPLIVLFGDPQAVSTIWLWIDVGLTLFFLIEFFTRSGFHWNPGRYALTRFFDFVAMVPVLVLVYYGVSFAEVWIWLVLIARLVRVIDRVLGDGFIRRNFLAVLEGFEEEISDRVIIRVLDRLQADLERGAFGHLIAESLERHKSSVLRRIREEHPQRGLAAGLARLTGIDAALERAEAQTFDAVVDILKSKEVDQAIRDSLGSTFSSIRKEIAVKSWRQNLGIRRTGQKTKKQG